MPRDSDAAHPITSGAVELSEYGLRDLVVEAGEQRQHFQLRVTRTVTLLARAIPAWS